MTIEPMAQNENSHHEVTQWACNYLTSHGYELKTNLPEIVQDTPWSYVIRFATSDGSIYLKQTPEQLALEASIIQTLRDQFHASVPIVIAYNAELNCFLMKDAGKTLRSILKQNFDEALLCKTIDQFTALQIATAENVDVFFDLGVPDWRLDRFPELYQQLLAQKDVLIADGLSERELGELKKLTPTLSSLCKKLSDYSIKPTLVQPDFNDNNTLIDDVSQKITLIDLGEISISHPFFSLLNGLLQIKKHHGLTEHDDRYLRIKDACLHNFMKVESKERLLEALAIARLLFPIYGVFAGYRMIFACDRSKFTGPFQRQARPGLSLREFINKHEDALQWAEHALASNIVDHKVIVETPWSVVYKIVTPQCVVYLKQVPEALFNEPDILMFLHYQGCKNIPEIIAVNPAHHCFLTAACGNVSLRELFKGQVNLSLLKTGISTYTTLQRQLENKMQFLLALSIPDWRLDKFALLYYQLISQDKLLLNDGLTEKEIKQLHLLYPTCQQLCDVLVKHDIPETISHCDFQDNNMVLDEKTGSISIVDWGEAVIAHPFFSLNGCLWNLTYFHALKPADPMYRQIQLECIAPWLNLYDEKTLLELFDIANQLLGIYAALEFQRLYVATQNSPLKKIQEEKRGSIAGCLRTFLNGQG